MALDDAAVFPTSVWDGDSANRDSDNGNQKAPDHRDWTRMLAEVKAAQTRVYNNQRGTSDAAIDSVGTVATKTGLSVVEKGNGAVHKTILTLDEVSIASTDGTIPATSGAWGTQLLYTFPEGHICVLGAHQVYPLAGLEAVTGGGGGLSDTADFEIGVGTVAATNIVAFDLDGGTDENLCAASVAALTGGTSDAIESSVNAAVLALDGSTAAVIAQLNFRTVDDADHGTVADALLVSGTVTIVWANIGND